LKQTPGAYTPPAGDRASFFDPEELDETKDVVEREVLTPTGYISHRSMSVSSTSQAQPAPIAQSRTGADPVLIRQTTGNSQSNISIKSNHSCGNGKPAKLKKTRPSPEHGHSYEYGASSSARTSFDKAISFVSRRSETDVVTQEELVQAARRKFEEKTALKELKYQREAEHRREIEEAKMIKREGLGRRRSEAYEVRDLPSTKAALKHLSGLLSGNGSNINNNNNNNPMTNKNVSDEHINSARPSMTGRDRRQTPPTDSLQTKSYESYRSASTPNPTANLFTTAEKPRSVERSRLSRLAQRSSKAVGISWWFHTKLLGLGSRD
jgi:hypothetical protein